MNIALRIFKQPKNIHIYVNNIYCGMINYQVYDLKIINEEDYKNYICIDNTLIMRFNDLTIFE